jgi:hypothetical protein
MALPPPPPPFGAWGSPYGVREHPQGTTILVLGVLSLAIGVVSCGLGLFLGPVAWIMGNNALAEIDRNPAAYSNRGNVQGGRICGIVASCLLVLGLISFLPYMLLAGSS